MAAVCKSPNAYSLERIVGLSPWSRRIRAEIHRLARYSSSVLVTGPSGSGKELIARAIHAESPRASKPFIPIDCASITGTLFASHMFGHVQGAFTGATHTAVGGFRAADGGTIFLDEIGELELDLQAKLLRVLQERTVVPVGSYQEMPVDVRVVAATNRDLGAEVRAGNFREDLYYRINVVSLRSDPLRDRPEDIEILARYIFAKLAVRHGMPLKYLSPRALEFLTSYAWPGNVRQLENVLERAALYSEFDEVGPQDLPVLDDPALTKHQRPTLPYPTGSTGQIACTSRPLRKPKITTTGNRSATWSGSTFFAPSSIRTSTKAPRRDCCESTVTCCAERSNATGSNCRTAVGPAKRGSSKTTSAFQPSLIDHLPLVLLAGELGSTELGLDGLDRLGQPRLGPRRLVGVNHVLGRRLIELLHRRAKLGLAGGCIAGFDGGANFANLSADARFHRAIASPTSFVLPQAFLGAGTTRHFGRLYEVRAKRNWLDYWNQPLSRI